MTTLKQGDKGAGVVELQAMLYEHGFLPRALEPRELGVFGKATREAVVYFQQCNRGADDTWLAVDGRVGPATWWALKNVDAVGMCRTQATIPTGLSALRVAVLTKALEFHALGVREIPNGSNRGPDVDSVLPKYVLKNKPGPAWCCYAAFALAERGTGAFPLGAHIGSCRRAYVIGKARGQLRQKPTPGDIFLMLGRDDNGVLTGRGHAGIVLRASDTEINTLEGNTGNRFAMGLRKQASIDAYLNFYGDVPATTWERGVVAVKSTARDTTR